MARYSPPPEQQRKGDKLFLTRRKQSKKLKRTPRGKRGTTFTNTSKGARTATGTTGTTGTDFSVSPLLANPDVAENILDYMDLDSMFRLQFCSKLLLLHNNNVIAYRHVIRAAVHESRRRGDVEYMNEQMLSSPCIDVKKIATTPFGALMLLMHRIRADQIYVPSVARLLRLVVGAGKGCELCGSATRIRDMRSWENGVAFCHRCMPDKIAYRRSKITCLRHDRLAGRQNATELIVLREPYRTKDGEWAGPILTYQDIDGRTSRNPPSFTETLKSRDLHCNKFKVHREDILKAYDQEVVGLRMEEDTDSESKEESEEESDIE